MAILLLLGQRYGITGTPTGSPPSLGDPLFYIIGF